MINYRTFAPTLILGLKDCIGMNEEQNNYCRNLIEVNKSRQVVTNQPIYNEQGILLLAKGSDLSEKRAEVLLQHKLMKPLEYCVGISSSFSAQQLYDYLLKFAHKTPVLTPTINNQKYCDALMDVCVFYEKYPLLQQNLTVLALRAREMYFHGIFSALTGLAIALEMKLTQQDLQTIFVAGLFHDVGFLYLKPELCNKTENFTQEEWKAMQAHPLIAQRFLKLAPELPVEISEAIALHHERIDGTGYPHKCFGDKLTIASQIIAATDNILDNSRRYEQYGEHSHRLILVALKLSDNVYLESVFDAAQRVFKKIPDPKSAIPSVPSVELLMAQQAMLKESFEKTRNFSQKLMTEHKDSIARSIALAMGRLAISVVRSGILQQEQQDWLAKAHKDQSQDFHFQLVEMLIMHDQILDQLIHLKNLIERALETLPIQDNEIRQTACQILNQISYSNYATA